MTFKSDFVIKELNGKRICYEIEKIKSDKNPLFFYDYDSMQFPALARMEKRLQNLFVGLRTKCILAEILFDELLDAERMGIKSRFFDEADVLIIIDLQYFIWENYVMQKVLMEGLIKLRNAKKQIIMTSSLTYDKINNLTENARAFFEEAIAINTKSVLCNEDMQSFLLPQYSKEELLCLDVNIDNYIVLKKYCCKNAEMALLLKLLKEYEAAIPNSEYEEILLFVVENRTQQIGNRHRIEEYWDEIKLEIYRTESLTENLYKTFIEPVFLKISAEIDGVVYVILSTSDSTGMTGRYVKKKFGKLIQKYLTDKIEQEVVVRIF